MTAGLHKWGKTSKAAPLACLKCGAVYASTDGAKDCPK